MKHASLLPVASLLLLCACSAPTQQSMTLDQQLQNPLFAERYYEDLTEQMVSLQLKNDAILKDSGKKSTVDATRIRGTQKAQAALDTLNANQQGTIISDNDLAMGEMVLIGNNLYVGTDFMATPGPSLHMYLSTVIDPRTAHFPDATAVDIGLVSNPYGAQTFTAPASDKPVTYRSAVLWDNALGKLYGFAQLQKN